MNEKREKLITGLGAFIADNPLLIAKRLNARGVTVPADANAEQIVNLVKARIAAKDKAFTESIAKDLLTGGYIGQDSFAGYDYVEGGGGALVGDVSGIGAAVGGVANMLGTLFGKIGAGKERRAQAQHDDTLLFMTILNRNTERERQAGVKARGKNTIILVAVIGFFVLLVIVLLVVFRKKG